MIADPLLIFERRLVGIERKMDIRYRGVEASSRLMDGLRWDGSLKEDSFAGFALAIVLFALATSLFFTPLPIFLKRRFTFVDKHGLRRIYLELCWSNNRVFPDSRTGTINEYKKADAAFCAFA